MPLALDGKDGSRVMRVGGAYSAPPGCNTQEFRPYISPVQLTRADPVGGKTVEAALRMCEWESPYSNWKSGPRWWVQVSHSRMGELEV